MSEELKELQISLYNKSINGTVELEVAFEFLQAAYDLAKSDEWVSVDSEIKPEDEQWVLVASPVHDGAFDIHLIACIYSKKYNTFTGYGEAQWDGRVTHWRRLPTPPNQ